MKQHKDACNPLKGESLKEKYGPLGAVVLTIVTYVAHYLDYTPDEGVLKGIALAVLAGGAYAYREFAG